MKKAFKIFGIVLVAILFLGTFVFLYQKSQPKEVVYELLTVDHHDISRSTVLTGTIEPRNEVAVKPQINGIIAELYKEAGQTVKQGEVIAKVKVIPEMSQLNSAESRVRLAHLNFKQSQTDFERAQKLYADKLISTEEFEKVQLSLRQHQEEVANATDALQITREGVSASTSAFSTTLIRSTIDGIILEVPIKVGNTVTMSNTFNDGTTIATVANMDDLIFKGFIDETEVGRLRGGMPMKISVGAIPEKEFKASLTFIAPKANANKFEVKGTLQTASGQTIRAGYSANAEIILEECKATLAIPESAVVFEGKNAFVYVLTSKADEMPQTFERRAIQTGLSDGVNIEVKSGLKKGEKVRGNQRQETSEPK